MTSSGGGSGRNLCGKFQLPTPSFQIIYNFGGATVYITAYIICLRTMLCMSNGRDIHKGRHSLGEGGLPKRDQNCWREAGGGRGGGKPKSDQCRQMKSDETKHK